jgi:hypothetical protein
MEEFYQEHVQEKRENGGAASKDAGNLGVDIAIKPNDQHASTFGEQHQRRSSNSSNNIS